MHKSDLRKQRFMGREKLLPRLADLPALGPPRLTGSTCESIWEIYPHFVSPTPQNAERGPCGRPPRSQRLNELCRPSPHRADSRTVPSSKLHTTVAPLLMFGISLEVGCWSLDVSFQGRGGIKPTTPRRSLLAIAILICVHLCPSVVEVRFNCLVSAQRNP